MRLVRCVDHLQASRAGGFPTFYARHGRVRCRCGLHCRVVTGKIGIIRLHGWVPARIGWNVRKGGAVAVPSPRCWSSTSRGVPPCQTSLPPRPPSAPNPRNPARIRTRRQPGETLLPPPGFRLPGPLVCPLPRDQRPERASGPFPQVRAAPALPPRPAGPRPRVPRTPTVCWTRGRSARQARMRQSPPSVPCRVFRSEVPTRPQTRPQTRRQTGLRANRRTLRRAGLPSELRNGPRKERVTGPQGLRTALPDAPARAATARSARRRATTAPSP